MKIDIYYLSQQQKINLNPFEWKWDKSVNAFMLKTKEGDEKW